jgi:hypothetical protein
MKTVHNMIEQFGGFDKVLERGGLKAVSEGFMPLVVEVLDHVQGLGYMVSVCHYGRQNGDMMRDPDMVFIVTEKNSWFPLNWQNDYICKYTEAAELKNGEFKIKDRKAFADLKSFSMHWDANLYMQGYELLTKNGEES